MLLLDASVLLAAFDPEDGHHDAARAILEDEEITLATMDLARYEVANVAVRAWRAPESVAPLLATIDRLREETDEDPALDGGRAGWPATKGDRNRMPEPARPTL